MTADKHPQDLGYDVQAFPGGRGTGIQSLYPEYDCIGEGFEGAAAAEAATAGAAAEAGLMPRVQEGFGKEVTGDAPPNAARRG